MPRCAAQQATDGPSRETLSILLCRPTPTPTTMRVHARASPYRTIEAVDHDDGGGGFDGRVIERHVGATTVENPSCFFQQKKRGALVIYNSSFFLYIYIYECHRDRSISRAKKANKPGALVRRGAGSMAGSDDNGIGARLCVILSIYIKANPHPLTTP